MTISSSHFLTNNSIASAIRELRVARRILIWCIRNCAKTWFTNNLCKKKLQTRFINLLGVVIPPNFLIFCKKLFSQASNEKVNVSTHKKIFLSEKKVNWWELMLSNFFFFKKKIFLNALKRALFTCKSIDFFVTCVSEQSKMENDWILFVYSFFMLLFTISVGMT